MVNLRDGVASVTVNDRAIVTVQLSKALAIGKGLSIAVRANGQTIGAGIITEVASRRGRRRYYRVMADVSPQTGSLTRDLIATWELVSRIDRTAAGERRLEPLLGDEPVALLYYDRTGHFAAQFMKRDRIASPASGADTAAAASAAPNNSRARGGYDAYFGTYTVDDAQGTVTQRLLGALSPENVGQLLTRAMTVQGDVLTIKLETATTSGEPVTRTLIWRRVG